MQTLADAEKMQAWSREQKRSGARIGFVPTMGFLHEGHLQLVDAAKAHSDRVVLSIFVNPTQFGPGEDLDRYPRDLERDLRLAAERGVDLCFTPSVEAIYPEGDQTSVVVTELTRGLCGPFRPGHFRGVTTVVAKLFNLVDPDVAVFGEKDFQQLRILERMVRDLKFPLEILAVPTHREADGLAMSSRNVYLSPEDRQEALRIIQGLRRAQQALAAGELRASVLQQVARDTMTAGGRLQVEYLEVVDAQDLKPVERVVKPARILTAVYLNQTRLIDNVPLTHDPAPQAS